MDYKTQSSKAAKFSQRRERKIGNLSNAKFKEASNLLKEGKYDEAQKSDSKQKKSLLLMNQK